MEDTGKLEERNKIVSELQTIIKERIELKEIEIPGTITFQVMSVDGSASLQCDSSGIQS